MHDPAPTWLTDALAREPRSVTTVVDGVACHRLEWGEVGRPVLVLLHGGGAHARWWSAVAGVLAAEWHVVAPDLSGHGRSAHRDTYTFTAWVAEVIAVLDAVQDSAPSEPRPPRRPIVLGHSMCGVVAAMVGAAHGERLGGVIVVDTPLDIPPPDDIGHAEQRMATPRLTPDRAELVARFRLLPDQPVVHPDLFRLVAEHSVAARPDGWTWAFDPKMFASQPPDRPHDMEPLLRHARCPTAMAFATRSPVVPRSHRTRVAAIAEVVPSLQVVDLQTHHHPMLDDPRELADRIAQVATGWAASATSGPA